MSDDLVKRLRDGLVEYPKRWSGDTHSDKGGPVDYDATDDLLEEAAARIEELEAENARLKKLLAEGALDSLAAEGQAFDAYEEQKEPFSEYGHYGENNPPVGMSSPGDKDYEV